MLLAMARPDKILYTAIAGKTLPLAGLLALLSIGVTTGDDTMDDTMDGGVGLPTWVTVAALAIGVVKVVADAWASYRTKSFEELTNRAETAEDKAKAKAKSEEAEQLQKKVYKLQASLSLAQTQAENAGVSADDLSLRDTVQPRLTRSE